MNNSELFDSLDSDSFYIEGADIADTKAPNVPIERRWEERRFRARLNAIRVTRSISERV